jgi:hypothetical protein
MLKIRVSRWKAIHVQKIVFIIAHFLENCFELEEGQVFVSLRIPTPVFSTVSRRRKYVLC